ncbi:hypothetical protein ACIQW4_01460 [Streptomyces albogriseolus]|jgi:hypothetical protein|uniref:hypothetical protein n=1 Tax=Streptomyces albogriseolus TaxID=1887 RepID=UPI0037FECF77
MDRLQILALYDWADGACFRHPCKGTVPTAVVGVLHPPAVGEREVRACAECVIALEEERRERARRGESGMHPDADRRVAE